MKLTLAQLIRPTAQRNFFLLFVVLITVARFWSALDSILSTNILGTGISMGGILIVLTLFLAFRAFNRHF